MPLDVLIVDDSAAIRRILQRVLVQADLPLGTVYEAVDGKEALVKLRAEKIGLVLADVNMPNMDGLELLAKLKSNQDLKHLPVIMISTEGSQEKVMQALKLGAQGYVRKPFTAEQIRKKLEGIV